MTVDLLAQDGRVLWSRKLEWQPQKKWTIYCCSYSHQDLGFGDYPHRLRTSIRHENIRLPLQILPRDRRLAGRREVPVQHRDQRAAHQFHQLQRQGRRAANWPGASAKGASHLGGLHNTANTEQFSHELMARLFYMSGRHAVDLLGVPAGKTIQNDDVIGLTWPLATYAKEAGLPYFFHGFNGVCGHCLNGQAAKSEPRVRIGNEPDFSAGPTGRLARRAYGGYAGDNPRKIAR